MTAITNFNRQQQNEVRSQVQPILVDPIINAIADIKGSVEYKDKVKAAFIADEKIKTEIDKTIKEFTNSIAKFKTAANLIEFLGYQNFVICEDDHYQEVHESKISKEDIDRRIKSLTERLTILKDTTNEEWFSETKYALQWGIRNEFNQLVESTIDKEFGLTELEAKRETISNAIDTILELYQIVTGETSKQTIDNVISQVNELINSK